MDLTKRSFLGTFFKRLLLGGVIAASLLYTALAARWALETRTALRTSEADEAGHTAARVVQGVVVQSPPTKPPSLPTHVAWMARLGEWRGGSKNRTYVVTCMVARIDGLRVEDSRTHETFTIDGYQWKAGDFAKGMTFNPRRVAVDLLRSDPPPISTTVSTTRCPSRSARSARVCSRALRSTIRSAGSSLVTSSRFEDVRRATRTGTTP